LALCVYQYNLELYREVKNDNSNDEISLPDIPINSAEEPLVDLDDHDGSLENPHEERQTIHSPEDMIMLTSAESDEENIPMLASTIYDIFYRPFECWDICMWDLIAKFEKLSLKKITSQEQMEGLYVNFILKVIMNRSEQCIISGLAILNAILMCFGNDKNW
jgi:hypothetical protein